VIGLGALVWPEAASSVGRAWGLTVVIAEIIFLLFALRRGEPLRPRSANVSLEDGKRGTPEIPRTSDRG